MILNSHPNHPSMRSYVLKLHFDAAPEQGRLVGQIEHIVSGEAFEFDSGTALLSWLQFHAARISSGPTPLEAL